MSFEATTDAIVERLTAELDGFTSQTYGSGDLARTVFIRGNTRVVIYGWADGFYSWRVDHWDPNRSWINFDRGSESGTLGVESTVGSILAVVEEIGEES